MLDLMTILLLTVLTLVADTGEPRASSDTDEGFVNLHFVVRGKPNGFMMCGCSVEGAHSEPLNLPIPQNDQPFSRVQSAPEDEAFTALSYETRGDACVVQFRGAGTSRFDRPMTFRFQVECTSPSELTIDVVSSGGIYRPSSIHISGDGQEPIAVAVTAVRSGNVLMISHAVTGDSP
jgi:hypothetical protein